jgi:hypothetical protein
MAEPVRPCAECGISAKELEEMGLEMTCAAISYYIPLVECEECEECKAEPSCPACQAGE